MAKKPVSPERTTNRKNSQTQKNTNNSKDKNPTTTAAKSKSKRKNKISKRVNDDASGEEIEAPVVPSSSAESQNDGLVESSEAEEENRIEERSTSEEDEKVEQKPENTKKGKKKDVKSKGKKRSKKEQDEVEEDGVDGTRPKSIKKEGKKEDVKNKRKKTSKKEKDNAEEENGADDEEEKKRPRSMNKNSKNEGVKNKGKKRRKEEDEDESDAEEKSENALYTFPMNRISRIIKSDNPDIKISQEAVFLINKATEKFLQLFSREAYASAYIDNKKYTGYNHLSSVVSKRRRLSFLLDFIPEKVKAEDALAQISEPEK